MGLSKKAVASKLPRSRKWLCRALRKARSAGEERRRAALPRNRGNLMEVAMIKGSCVCGGNKFEIERVVALTHCHGLRVPQGERGVVCRVRTRPP